MIFLILRHLCFDRVVCFFAFNVIPTKTTFFTFVLVIFDCECRLNAIQIAFGLDRLWCSWVCRDQNTVGQRVVPLLREEIYPFKKNERKI